MALQSYINTGAIKKRHVMVKEPWGTETQHFKSGIKEKSFCKACGLDEFDLTSDCSGRQVTDEERNGIQRNMLNFRDNGWWARKS